jgi:AhpD family alkylhydroperoxidase
MERINFITASPLAYQAMTALECFIGASDIERSLVELVKLRSSQINGCAYCVDLHTRDARAAGETERRLHAVAVWRETPFFSARERAALGWTEALTRLARGPASDAEYALLSAQFAPKDMVDLTMVINTINSWNRLAVGFGKMPAL